MKKLYTFLLLFFLGAALPYISLAGHVMGAEIGYFSIAPNVYSVRLKIYRDCAAFPLSSSMQINLKADGCNAGRNVMASATGTPRTGNPYCTQQPVNCSAGGLETFEEKIYTATVTFTAAEAQCTDWVFSYSLCNRGPSGNIQNATNVCLYVDAFLKLNSTINNSSPEFSELDVLNVAYNEKVTYSTYALDSDGDSLVYSLQNALTNANTPVTYMPGRSGTSPVASSPPMQLDPVTGSISFIPNTVPMPGSNQHTLAVQVDEYRNVNGVATRVGSAKRDMVVIVVNSQVGGVSNANPYTVNPMANGQLLGPNTVIQATAGTPLVFQVDAFDANPNDVLSMTSDAAIALPGATFNATGTPLKGTVTWTPAANQVRDHLYYFRVGVKDDFCLTRGIHTQTYAVRVSNAQNPTGVTELLNQPVFLAFPNPFTEEVSFKISGQGKNQEILIFNVLGQLVDKVETKNLVNSENQVVWKNSGQFPAGSYVARLVAKGGADQAVKFTKLR